MKEIKPEVGDEKGREKNARQKQDWSGEPSGMLWVSGLISK